MGEQSAQIDTAPSVSHAYKVLLRAKLTVEISDLGFA